MWRKREAKESHKVGEKEKFVGKKKTIGVLHAMGGSTEPVFFWFYAF